MTGGDGRYVLGTGGGLTVHSALTDEYAESRWKADRLRRVFAL
jgi:para-aminobenzoate synthetase